MSLSKCRKGQTVHLAVYMPGVGNIKMGVRKDISGKKKIVYLIEILVGNKKNLARGRLSRHE